MKKIWNIFSGIGIHPELSTVDIIKTRLFNRIILMVLVSNNIMLLISFLFNLPQMWPEYLANQAICFTILLLHHYKRYQIPLLLACFVYPTWLAATIMFSEPTQAESNIFILNILFGMIGFQDKKKMMVTATVYNIMLCAGSFYYLQSISGNVIIDNNPFDNIIINIIAAIIAFLMLGLYQNEISLMRDQRSILIKTMESKNKELESFAYVTSHDLKEPVRTIGSFAGLLRKKLEKKSIGKGNEKIIDEIEQSAHQLSKLIDSILEFTTLDQEKAIFKPVDLNELLSDLTSSHEVLLEQKGAQIQYDDLPEVKGDRLLLSLLFCNLIENGIKFNASETPKITIDHQDKDDHYEVTVSDNGTGIDERFKNLIFEPFKSLRSKSEFRGSGLGLSICRKIVESHDGEIWLKSKLGQGSTFHITLQKPNCN